MLRIKQLINNMIITVVVGVYAKQHMKNEENAMYNGEIAMHTLIHGQIKRG